jgi:hypothetical protein
MPLLTQERAMNHLFALLIISVTMMVAQGFQGNKPQPAGYGITPKARLPIGKWKVEFTNEVTETCTVENGGEASVDEPKRRSNGTWVAKDGTTVITFNDDRIERWTPVGKRFVVEHWFPGSQLPTVAPVLGIAERVQ